MSRKQKAYRAWYHKANAWDMNLQRAFAEGWDAHKGLAHARTIQELQAENKKLRSMCKAAACEIDKAWDAHCDNSGSGPVTLLARLEGKLPPELYPALDDAAIDAAKE